MKLLLARRDPLPVPRQPAPAKGTWARRHSLLQDGAAATRPVPLTVLFVHQSADLYGSDRVLLEAATALQDAGGHAIVAVPEDGPLVAELRRRGIETAVLPGQLLKLQRATLTPRGLLALAGALPKALAALDACVAGRPVHLVQSNTLAVLAGVAWAAWRAVPHLWHVHEIVERPRVMAWAFPWLLRVAAGQVVCNSRATCHWLVSAQPRLAGRTQVVLNGVPDLQLLAAAAAPRVADLQQAFRPPGTHVAIGLVGRINRMKGHQLLLDAAERLHHQGIRHFSLVFAGSPPAGQPQWQEALQQRIAASPLAGRVLCLGFVPDMAPVYAALDIVCVPSTEAESFGLVATEAMSAGRPVVAAATGGLPEIVSHGHTGLLHAPGDADALAQALALLLADPARCQVLGAAGRLRFEAVFRHGVMHRQLLQCQQRCAGPASPQLNRPVC
jgi:glycosyltransferase involved in cell wall biosynthesis